MALAWAYAMACHRLALVLYLIAYFVSYPQNKLNPGFKEIYNVYMYFTDTHKFWV